MNRFLSRLSLGIFLLATLPLQSFAAMNAAACGGTHGDAHATASFAIEPSLDTSSTHHTPRGDFEEGMPSSDKTAPTGFTCGHGAPCCFGAALVASVSNLEAETRVTMPVQDIITTVPSIPPSSLERPPRNSLA
jgi:hypothetical protein